MAISGEFGDFKWTADVEEEDLPDESGSVDVEIITPTGGKIGIIVYGPWEDVQSLADIIEQDGESYVDIS
jgi:hypothetical protein